MSHCEVRRDGTHWVDHRTNDTRRRIERAPAIDEYSPFTPWERTAGGVRPRNQMPGDPNMIGGRSDERHRGRPPAETAVVSRPRLKRAARVIGRTLVLRDATLNDAEFIVALRTNPVNSVHLSATSADIDRQIAWLKSYVEREDEAYFIITARDAGVGCADRRVGTVRLYAPRGNAFCWGSWVVADAPATAAIESALMVYAYALDHLKFSSAYFEVRAANKRVWAFHERFGAVRTGVHEDSFLYTLSGDAIRKSMMRYRRFLPKGVEVQP